MGWTGPGRCVLCSNSNETVDLFLRCIFVHNVWGVVLRSVPGLGPWQGGSLGDVFSKWYHDGRHTKHRALPVIVSWGIWLARNARIYQDKFTHPEVVAANCVAIMGSYPMNGRSRGTRMLFRQVIDRGRPWVFFDGALQGQPVSCGGCSSLPVG